MPTLIEYICQSPIICSILSFRNLSYCHLTVIFFLSERSNCSNGPKRLLKIKFYSSPKRLLKEKHWRLHWLFYQCPATVVAFHSINIKLWKTKTTGNFFILDFITKQPHELNSQAFLEHSLAFYFINKWVEGNKGNSIIRKKQLF